MKNSFVIAVVVSALSPLMMGAGSTQPKPPKGEPTTPSPVRQIVPKPVGTRAFQLPNGSRVEIGADLESMLNSVVTLSTRFSPTDAGAPADPCEHRIELRSAVTALEMNIAEVGLKFGYNPSGDLLDAISDIKGRFKTRVGVLAMDFQLWECFGDRCSAVAAVTKSHLTAGVSLEFDIDFGIIDTGPSFVFNTPMARILRILMEQGVRELEASHRLSELSWRASVRRVNAESGTVLFDRGHAHRIEPNQTFVVYGVSEATGACDVFEPIAHLITTEVDAISSFARVERSLDARGVQVGDYVMVRQSPRKTK